MTIASFLVAVLIPILAFHWRELVPAWRWLRGEGRLLGLWRHRKGGLYLALGVVQDSEKSWIREGTDLKPEQHVLYWGFRKGWWVRPLWMFTDGRFRRFL